jgi:hypothetical protein
VLATVSLLLSSLSRADNTNKIDINQVAGSNNLDLTIEQIGYNNKIFFSLGDADDTVIDMKQLGNNNEIGYVNDSPSWGSGVAWGGDIDFDDQNLKLWQNCTTTTCNKNDIQFHISYGTNNKFWWAQGYTIDSRTDTSWAFDTYDKGGHKVTADIHGSNNVIVGHQNNCSTGACDGHTATILLYGNSNSIYGKQVHDGEKEFNFRANNSNNTVDWEQQGTGEHTANIVLNGSYGTDLDLIQQGNSDQTYSLTQTCNTASGCNVTVTQQ